MSDLLSAADVAALLGVSPARIYQMVSCNQLPFIRIAGRIRIPRPAWEEWLKRQTEAALASMEGALTATPLPIATTLADVSDKGVRYAGPK